MILAGAISAAAPADVAVGKGTDTVQGVFDDRVVASDSIADTIADTIKRLSTPATQPDTAALDSATRRNVADSLMTIQRGATAGFSQFPGQIDSIFGLAQIRQRQLFTTDASDGAEQFRLSPDYVHVPFTIAGALNRPLHRGMPASVPPGQDVADATIDYRDYIGIVSPGELFMIDAVEDPASVLRMHPKPLASPLMLLCWENGVFGETSLQMLFARPIARTIMAAVYTNYRYFAAQNFSHDAGAINSTFEGMGVDTSFNMYRGRNPLIDEMISGVRVEWDGGGPRASANYRYADLHDEIAVPGSPSPTTTSTASTPGLTWSNVAHFIHLADVSVTTIPAGPSINSVDLFLRSVVQNQRPGIGHSVGTARGTATWGGAGFRSSLPLSAGDTLSARYRIRAQSRTPYDGLEWHLRSHRVFLEYTKQLRVGDWITALDASVGEVFNAVEDSSGNALIWNGNLSAASGRFTGTLFGRRDAYEYTPPLDTALQQRGAVLDPVSCFGGNVRMDMGKAGFLAGYSHTTEIDTATISRFWPGGVAPYRQPHSVVTLAPEIGRLWRLAAYSRWMISDVKPHLKVQSALSYQAAAAGGNEHLDVDLGLDYWSVRDLEPYAGSNMWNREIWNLNVKVTVQIKEFRLFFKMDNLFNREIAYVPGYLLPGLVFRWGFNWLLQR